MDNALSAAAFLPALQNALFESESDPNPKFTQEEGPAMIVMDSDLILHEVTEVTYDPENGAVLVRIQEI